MNNHESRTNVCTIEPSKRFKYLEKLLSRFWKRWSTEYLTSLREFQKRYRSKNSTNIPGVNDIVIIKEDKALVKRTQHFTQHLMQQFTKMLHSFSIA